MADLDSACRSVLASLVNRDTTHNLPPLSLPKLAGNEKNDEGVEKDGQAISGEEKQFQSETLPVYNEVKEGNIFYHLGNVHFRQMDRKNTRNLCFRL